MRGMAPTIERFDHLHVYVSDRVAAEVWYDRVLGFRRIPEYEHWAADGGPLTIANASGSVHIALFERPASARHATLALLVSREGFSQWLSHARAEIDASIEPEDHGMSWSIYFRDPDGNPFEITSYEYDGIATDLGKS